MSNHSPQSGQRIPGINLPVVTTVRDALYDRIPLSQPELSLLSTPEFIRLERIQQLGFVSRVWPGARHTRFEHSLGVLHLARLAIAHLRSLPNGDWIRDEDARAISAAALLHDIGHYPFSHAIEELGSPIVSHEAVGRRLIEGPVISEILRSEWQVDPARVAAIVDSKSSDARAEDAVLRGVLSGPLDVDKLDYLPRDARACHVPYGGVDTARLLDSLRIIESEDGNAIAIGDKGISPLHSLINARQEMFDNVYWHHANRACMVMLLRAVQEAMLDGAVRADQLTSHDDASLLALFASPEMPEPTRRLTSCLQERRIYKRAIEVSARAVELYGRLGNLFFDPAARRNAENAMTERLARLLGREIPPASILIDIPKPEKWRTDVLVQFDMPPIGFEPLMTWREVVGLGDEDFKRYEEHRRLVRIVASAEIRDEVAQNWESIVNPLVGELI